MDEAPQPSLGDRIVEGLARALDALGLDGRRLRWRWARRRTTLAEARERSADALRPARGKHKMCPACRALVPRSASRCPECGEALHGVSTPGPGRILDTLFPGLKAATSLIMLVNGVLFLLLLMTPDPDGSSAGQGLGRLLGFNNFVLLRYGAGAGFLVRADAEWFRMFTSLFLHSGLIHFAFNSMALLSLGPLCEQLFGPARFWIAYLVAGLAGNVAAQLLVPRGTVVGASGAICGLVGLLLAFGLRRGGGAGQQLRAAMLQNTMFILIMSLLPGVSLLSHAGGFAGGFVAGLVFPSGPPRTRAAQIAWQALALAGVIAVLAAFREVAMRGSDFQRYLE